MKPKKGGLFFSLRSRILVLFGALFVASFVFSIALEELGMPFLGVDGDFQTKKIQAVNTLNLLADMKKDRLKSWLEERLGDSLILSHSHIVGGYAKDITIKIAKTDSQQRDVEKIRAIALADKNYRDANAYLHNFIAAYERIGDYKDAMMIDGRTGRIILDLEGKLLGMDASNETYFKEIAENEGLFVGIVSSTLEKKPQLYIARPIESGVLVLEINLETIFSAVVVTGKALGKTGDVVLVNDDRIILVPLRFPLPSGIIPKPLEYQIQAKGATLAADGQEQFVDSIDYRGVHTWAVTRYLPITSKTGWGMVVKQDYDEIFATELTQILHKTLINTTALLIILAISVWVANSLSKPIGNMAAVVEEVENGNYDVRADASGTGEIQQLSERINSMIIGISTRKKQLEHEVQERKKAEQEVTTLNSELEDRVRRRTAALNAANKELEAFAYSVSHDLRAPLRGIDGFSLAILEDYGDKLDQTGQDYLRRIRAGTLKMSLLIDDLLKLSRITRDKMRVEEVDLSQIASSVAEELKKQEPTRDVEFIIKATPKVSGDGKLLRVALENLIGNAWKFTSKVGDARIEFGSTEMDGERVFFIRDNGAGFDMSYKEMLFAPFHRLHTSEEFQGTGIGLATVKRIFLRHGGRIWGEGEINKGATFFFVV